MPIIQAEIKYFKSAGSNSTGGAITATEVTDATLNNLFDDITSAEADAGVTDYRKIFVKNTNASITWSSIKYWRQSATTSADDEITVGIGTADDDDGSNELTAWSAAAVVSVESDAADTRNVTVVGEDASGDRLTETVALNGTTPVLTSASFTKVYLVYPASSSARTVTIKQGSGGTTRGTIGPSKLSAICYFSVTSTSDGLELGNLAAAATHALWLKRVVSPGAALQASNSVTLRVQGETT